MRRVSRSTSKSKDLVSSEALSPDDPTLDELAEAFLAYQRSRNLSPYTLRNYASTFKSLRCYAQERGVSLTAATLTTETIRDYQRWLLTTPLDRPRKGSTDRDVSGVLAIMRQLRAFARWLEDEEYLCRPVKFTLPRKPVKRLEVLDERQVTALFRSRYLTGDTPAEKRNRALVCLLLDSGLRVAEVAGIEDADLFLAAGFVRVRGKGNKERLVPFSERTARVIRTWIEARDAEPVELVGPGKGKTFELGREGVMSMVERAGADVGLRLHSHLLRHTCATTLLKNGMDLATLQRVLGHSSIAITQAYLHLRDEDIKAKHSATSPMEHFTATPASLAKRRMLRRGTGEEGAGMG